ncbi:hypothetical protein [Streptomyces sp. MS2.AVA.5]|uniref:Uncharacterized protein n=1 Tax=Streptomyces achmelvichensis TaxID=3134111 RepID=A0ACC6PQL5_9ACTN
MQRSSKRRPPTAANVLAGVAAWAVWGLSVTGCVSVAPGSAPVPAPAGSRPVQVLEPRVGQAPVREALAPPAARETTPPLPAVPPSESAVPRRHDPSPVPPRQTEPTSPTPRALTPVVPTSRPDVCALSEGYGGWRPDSAQARICRDAYGR